MTIKELSDIAVLLGFIVWGIFVIYMVCDIIRLIFISIFSEK